MPPIPFNPAVVPVAVAAAPLPVSVYVPQKGCYLWPIGEEESARISKLLLSDFESLQIPGHWVNGPPMICAKCSKVSGLDDFIYSKLKAGAHVVDSIIESIKDSDKSQDIGHALHCCNCDTAFSLSSSDKNGIEITIDASSLLPGEGNALVKASELHESKLALPEDNDEDIVWVHPAIRAVGEEELVEKRAAQSPPGGHDLCVIA